ncbi:MAG: cobalamin B12-binding domain-containing protein [Rhodospirillales bacterium]|nr:cobalamin B12-binding domain-containing protein [Rhodospirillales bacterium]
MSLKGKRILIAKPGLDGHDVGAKIIALALRDAGADVIYTGLRKSPEYIARIAVDEDVDAVGLSVLSGSHNELVAETMKLLRDLEADDIKIFVGGTVSGDDVGKLKDAGVAGVFTSEMKIEDTLAEIDLALA